MIVEFDPVMIVTIKVVKFKYLIIQLPVIQD